VILKADGLSKAFPVRRGRLVERQRGSLVALDNVSFGLRHGEALGVVGESGCGKSTLAKVLLGLLRPSAGSVVYRGQDLARMSPRQLREVRKHIQIVLQDPYSSLNPRMTIGEALAEPFEIHSELSPRRERLARVKELLEMVGLNPDFVNRYPHQFSGGQRQRAVVARALAVRPEILVCDEPVSSLDVSAQAQILALLRSLQRELNLAYVFIAHDLSVVRYISDRIAVMYLGRIVEMGDKHDLCSRPSHPYTQALFSAAPVPDPLVRSARRRIVLEGDVPSPLDRPSGCRFRTRCWKAEQVCRSVEPELAEVAGTSLQSACHFATPDQVGVALRLPPGPRASPGNDA
jgi:oligopeptide transport system ATP-binding protein